LRLPRHCDEGKQDGDDGLLVHISSFFLIPSIVLPPRDCVAIPESGLVGP
jgi:hypothetical protein